MGTGWTAPRRLISPTGATLKVYTQPAAGMPRGVVQINHGLAEHAGRYHRFAAALAASGFTVYAHDHRGHGGTTARDAQPGRFAASGGPQKLVADIDAVRDMIAVEMPGIPVILLGHSMGGILTVSYLARWSSRLAGAAVWNANLAGAVSARAALTLLFWETLAARLGRAVAAHAAAHFPAIGPDAIPAAARDSTGCRAIPPRSTNTSPTRCAASTPRVSLWRDVFAIIIGLGADDAISPAVREELAVQSGRRRPATPRPTAARPCRRSPRASAHWLFRMWTTKIYPENRHESLNELNQNFIMPEIRSPGRTASPSAPTWRAMPRDMRRKRLLRPAGHILDRPEQAWPKPRCKGVRVIELARILAGPGPGRCWPTSAPT